MLFTKLFTRSFTDTKPCNNLRKMRNIFILSVIVFVGLCYADTEQFLPKIPDIDQFSALKERCDQKAGEGTYDRLKNAIEDTKTCATGLVNVTKIKIELEEAQKTGSMDEVFGKYCAKRPQLRECIKKTVDIAKECMEDTEKQALNLTTNILEQIGDFACYQDGDRLAMFIAEGGVSCIQERTEGVQECVNKTLKIDQANFSPNSIPTLTIDKKKCDDLTELQNCIVEDMEKCDNTTPANIIDALFKFIKKVACKNVKSKRSVKHVNRSSRAAEIAIIKYQDEFLNRVKSLCKKNDNEDVCSELLAKLKSTIACILKYKPIITPKQQFIEHLLNCSENTIQLMESHLPDQSKYYPKFFLHTIKALIDFVYNHESLFSPSLHGELKNCVQRMRKTQLTNELKKCSVHSVVISQDEEVIVPPKEEICKSLKNSHGCITNLIKKTCENFNDFKQIFQDFILALEHPCYSENKTL